MKLSLPDMEFNEQCLDAIEQNGFCSIPLFLTADECEAIRKELSELEHQAAFKKAGIGREGDFHVDASRRGDFISWIDQQAPQPSTGIFLEKINDIILQLNRNFYLGIRDFECHYAIYPAGTFYEKHSDRHQRVSHRKVSFVLYLNQDWQQQDGGELRIFPAELPAELVEPREGTLALFLSHIEHEVLITHRRRMSITGWMLDQKIL